MRVSLLIICYNDSFRDAFWQDVRLLVKAWREERGLPAEPPKALVQSGYAEKITKERGLRNADAIASDALRFSLEKFRSACCGKMDAPAFLPAESSWSHPRAAEAKQEALPDPRSVEGA